jgi:hypothetical protein
MIRALLLATAAAATVAGIALAPPAHAGDPYANCADAHNDGRWNIPKGDPDYSPCLDKDHDGIACEG